jgi:hypothetical protein
MRTWVQSPALQQQKTEAEITGVCHRAKPEISSLTSLSLLSGASVTWVLELLKLVELHNFSFFSLYTVYMLLGMYPLTPP